MLRKEEAARGGASMEEYMAKQKLELQKITRSFTVWSKKLLQSYGRRSGISLPRGLEPSNPKAPEKSISTVTIANSKHFV